MIQDQDMYYIECMQSLTVPILFLQILISCGSPCPISNISISVTLEKGGETYKNLRTHIKNRHTFTTIRPFKY